MTGGSAWRDTLFEVGRDLAARGLVTSHGGNLSIRRPAGGALITATGTMLGRLTAPGIVAVAAGGTLVNEDAAAPSSNTAIHLAIYRLHPHAGAVLHAHPPHAIARSLVTEGDSLHPANFEAQLLLGAGVPIVTVVDHEAPEVVAEALGRCPIVIVRGHGTFAMARDLWQALNYTTALEEAAQILVLAGDAVAEDGTPLRRTALLALEQDLHARWQRVVAATAPDARRADGWTLHEVVAHVAAWQRYAIERLLAIAAGEGRRALDADAFNDRVRAEAAGRSWPDVQAEADDAHRAFLAAIASTPREVLEADAGLGAFVVAVNGFGHYAEHLHDFEAGP
ncbi:MAG: class II aldolase/adducin family protein [Dehalococcoidia bacterium]|nr:class II aldolase/adducin family protein [Dehalococcoidia bacterium]